MNLLINMKSNSNSKPSSSTRRIVLTTTLLLIALLLIVITTTTVLVVASSSSETDNSKNSISTTSASIDDEYCCCSSDELATNSAPLLRVLDELVTKPYFRYFRVNVKKKCPYWVVHLLCTQKGNPCKFCRCDAEDIPVSLRTESDMGNALDEKWGEAEEDEVVQQQQQIEGEMNSQNQVEESTSTSSSSLDLETDHSSTIGKFDKDHTLPGCSSSNGNGNNNKKKPTTATTQKKCREEPPDPKAEYVDLVRNPEGNTFYLGEKASRVWRAIYEENCFNLIGKNSTNVDEPHQCREQLAFYRLISGLHTSISTHIAAYYHFPILPGDPRYKPTTSAEDEELHQLAKMTPEEKHMTRAYAKPNCQVFDERLTKKPHHVDNMHFLYRFVIRALTRSRSAFVDPETNKMREALRIGDDLEDAATEQLVEKLFHQHILCSPTFNESKLLQEPNAVAMLPEMKKMIRNMTTILDCISCEKCRLWGKVQLVGLATAFKIVMNPADEVPPLERKELMSLVNLARQLTDSVHNVNVLCKRAPQCPYNKKQPLQNGNDGDL